MKDPLNEIMARHEALTACGCNCCDDDYSAYVERQEQQRQANTNKLPDSAAEVRKSVRFQYEGSKDK